MPKKDGIMAQIGQMVEDSQCLLEHPRRWPGPDPRNCPVTAVVSARDFAEIMYWICMNPGRSMDHLVSDLLARFAQDQRNLEHAYKV